MRGTWAPGRPRARTAAERAHDAARDGGHHHGLPPGAGRPGHRHPGGGRRQLHGSAHARRGHAPEPQPAGGAHQLPVAVAGAQPHPGAPAGRAQRPAAGRVQREAARQLDQAADGRSGAGEPGEGPGRPGPGPQPAAQDRHEPGAGHREPRAASYGSHQRAGRPALAGGGAGHADAGPGTSKLVENREGRAGHRLPGLPGERGAGGGRGRSPQAAPAGREAVGAGRRRRGGRAGTANGPVSILQAMELLREVVEDVKTLKEAQEKAQELPESSLAVRTAGTPPRGTRSRPFS